MPRRGCTASQSNEPIEQAAEALRDRGRLVDVGITKIELPWKLFYEKELEFRFSRSYGPGRYDASYEVDGRDYPSAYVRWTENRNMQSYLELIAELVEKARDSEEEDAEPIVITAVLHPPTASPPSEPSRARFEGAG